MNKARLRRLVIARISEVENGRREMSLLKMKSPDVAVIIRRTNMGTVFGATSGTSVFGSTSTTEDALAGIDLLGKRILVTGVSAGSELRRRARLQHMVRRSSARHGI